MRLSVLAGVVVLTGCVSHSQPDGYHDDNFSLTQAANTRVSLGLAYLKNGNYQQAKVNLDRALEYTPQSADVLFSLAFYYQTVEELARADEYYQNALSLAPENSDIANSYGVFLCQQKKYPQANTFFRKALANQQYANSAQTYENLAICAQAQGHNEDAIAYLEDALNHEPGRPQSLFLLTQIYAETEQWNKAQTSLRRYERVARVSPESIQMALVIARGSGDKEAAAGFGDMLLSLYPGSQQAEAWLSEKAQSVEKARVVRKKKAQSTGSSPAGAQKKSPSSFTANTEIKESEQTDEQNAYHVVSEGENLFLISSQYNVTVRALKEWNNLTDTSEIIVGSRLRIKPLKDNSQEVK